MSSMALAASVLLLARSSSTSLWCAWGHSESVPHLLPYASAVGEAVGLLFNLLAETF